MLKNKQVSYILLFCCFSIAIHYVSCVRPALSQEPLMLFDFENQFSADRVQTEDATFRVTEIDNNQGLLVSTGKNLSKPGVVIEHDTDKPWTLRGYHQVKADVTNVGDEFIQAEMFVGNDPDGLIRWYCSDYVDLMPNETKTITVDLSWTPWVHSPQLDIVGMRGIPGKIKTDLSKIEDITFYSRYATQENEFFIHNVRAVGQVEERDTSDFFPFIDKFGQYVHRDWKDKISSIDELKNLDQRDIQDIKDNPEGPERSQYGGWTGGPKLEATGWFRTEKVDDRWWMVDPEGYPFWSAGIVCALSHYGMTGVQGRENYFKELPVGDSELGQFYLDGQWSSHGFYMDKVPFKAFNFYEANLHRKYGQNWKLKFYDRMHQRFDSWGMNTFGNVSDMEAAAQQMTPYTGTIWINGTPKIEGSSGYWGKFHDVFDPGFRAAVRTSMEAQKTGSGDPWCMGFFIDNEMSWGDLGSLSLGTLKSPASQPAKIEFINDLKKTYTIIEKLNASWGSDYSSWETLLNSTNTPNEKNAQQDLNRFYAKVADTYFRIVREELNRTAPNQLYLGCRFAWANNDVTMRAASRYCDIVSFNKYEYSIENVGLPSGEDKPIMIGEFHFGSLDRGSVHVGVKKAESQEHRGQLYKAYIEGALRNPAIVGAHWFQYTDQMVTGREDGENYNVGFVDICDVPYEEFIQGVRETNYSMYEYRANQSH